MIEIVTDSTCDIPKNISQSLGITVIPAHLNIGQQTYRDEVDITRKEFYDRLVQETEVPRTSSPSPGEFIDIYTKLLQKAQHIVSIHVASTLSGIYNTARLAAEELARDRIYVIDSGQVTMGLGWVAMAAAEAARAGAKLEDVLGAVQDTLARVQVYAIFNTLEFLARSGRVNLVQLRLSTLLQIKPMVELKRGTIEALERVRTWSKAVGALAERVRGLGPIERLAILHTNCMECATDLRTHILDILPTASLDNLTVDATTVIGAHVGPHALGVATVVARQK